MWFELQLRCCIVLTLLFSVLLCPIAAMAQEISNDHNIAAPADLSVYKLNKIDKPVPKQVRILPPPQLLDPASKSRSQQMRNAYEAQREGDLMRAQKTLDAIGLSFAEDGQTIVHKNAPPQPTSTKKKKTQTPTYIKPITQNTLAIKQQEILNQKRNKQLEEYRKTQMQHYLMNAIKENQMPWVLHALKNGADVNTPYADYTPLQYAVMGNRQDIALYLLQKGASVGNEKNRFYDLLFHTSKLGAYRIIEVLLHKGADPRIEDKEGRQAWEYAKADYVRELLMTTGDRTVIIPTGKRDEEPILQELLDGSAEENLFPSSPAESNKKP